MVREYYNVFSNLIHAKGLLTGLLMDASFDADSNASWEYAGARIPFKAGVYAHTRPNISAMA